MPTSPGAAKEGFAASAHHSGHRLPFWQKVPWTDQQNRNPWDCGSFLPTALWPQAPILFVVTSGQLVLGHAGNSHLAWEVDLLCRSRKVKAPISSRPYLKDQDSLLATWCLVLPSKAALAQELCMTTICNRGSIFWTGWIPLSHIGSRLFKIK